MSSNPMTPAIAAAVNTLQPYVNAGRVAISVSQGGAMLEIRTLDPTLTIPPPATLQLLRRPGLRVGSILIAEVE